MKDINGQLYGYSYELDATSEDDGTKCFAVDTGTVFVAYKGVWYEQPGSLWAASISEGEDDLLGTSWEIGKVVPADDLLVFNAVDTGKRYVSFNGKWYEQPVQWSAPAAGANGGSELPEVTSDDNGDVLTVVDGEWDKAAPSGGGAFVVHATWGDTPETEDTCTLDKTWSEINSAAATGAVVSIINIYDAGAGDETGVYLFCGCYIDQHISGNEFKVGTAGIGFEGTVFYAFVTDSADGYPAYLDDGTA